MYINKSLKEYGEQVASNSSMPGGGSVAGLVSSLGGALTLMVMSLTQDKKAFKELDKSIQTDMLEKSKKIESLREELDLIVDEDTKAFNSVLESFRLPNNTEEEKETRKNSIKEGYKKALSVPLRCMELSLEILRNQKLFAVNGNPGLITDVGIGSILTYSAMESSKLNILINLREISDEEYKREIEDRISNNMKMGRECKEEILKIVYGLIE